MESENVADKLLAALRRHGLDITMEQLHQDSHDDTAGLWHRAFDECERRCEPKEKTLESMILWSGEQYLEEAHLVCACEMFPNEQ